MKKTPFATKCLRKWATISLVSLAVVNEGPAQGSRFNPGEFTSHGDLVVTNGETIVFDTSALTYELNGGGATNVGVAAANDSGNVVVAMFNFDSVSIDSNVTITVTGNRGLVMGSLGSITLKSAMNVDGTAGTSSTIGEGGPGAEGGVRNVSFNSAPPPADAGNGGWREGTGVGYGAGNGRNRAVGVGGGYGGMGGGGGVWYGDLTLTDLFGGSGGAGGDGDTAGRSGNGGGGGGTIELTALDTITLTSSLLARGGNGGNAGTGGSGTQRSGGGGSGGAILLNAPTVVLDAGSVLRASGGGAGVVGNDGGGGGGGRIAIYSDALTQSGAINVTGGAPGNILPAPEDGSLFIDEKNGVLFLSGRGVAANQHSAYTSLTVMDGSELALGGTGVVATLTVSNATEVTLAGRLTLDVDGGGAGSADRLVCTNGLTLSGSTLDISEINPVDDLVYVLAEYGSLVGSFSVVNGLPPGYRMDYAHNGNQVALVPSGEISVLPASVDFGIVAAPATSNVNVVVTNSGSGLLTITDVSVSGADAAQFSVLSSPPAVEAGTASNIVVQYQPLTDGIHSANLDVASDDPDNTPVHVALSGEGVAPDITLPASVDFGSVPVSATSNLNVSVGNTGSALLTIAGVTLSGSDSNQFTVVSFPDVVDAGTSSNIVVQYHPDLGGAHVASLDVASDDPDEGIASAALGGGALVEGSRLDPGDFASNGPLVLGPGDTITFNTGALVYNGTVTGAGTTAAYVGGQVELALFNFDDISIDSNVTITVVGTRGLVLGSLGSISLGSAMNVDGTGGTGTTLGLGGPGAEGGVRNVSFNSAPPPADAGNGGGRQASGVGFGAGNGRNNASGVGGGYGGMGGGGGGVRYGDLMLTDLFGGSGGAGGDGDSAGRSGNGGGGGGTIELTALDTITLSSSLLARGGNGGNAGTAGSGTQRSGGGGSGGAILLHAPTIVLDAGSTLGVNGGNPGLVGVDGGGGGGGRIAIYSDALTQSGGVNVNGGAPGANVGPPEPGSLFIDENNGVLFLSGRGVAANEHSSYASLTVTNLAELALGGAGVVATVTVSNANEVSLSGTLTLDVDGGGAGSADRLVCTNGLALSGSTLKINEIGTMDDPVYIIAEYGSLTGTFAAVSGLPSGYGVAYAHNGNQIALVPSGEIQVPDAVDFGTVLALATSNLNVGVTNTGTALLTITGVSISGADAGMFMVLSFPPAVDIGTSSNIVVRYQPLAAGLHSATLEVASDDQDKTPALVALSGEAVAPDITLPASVDFGSVPISATSNLNVSVGNTGSAPLAVAGVSLSGSDSNQFTVVSFPDVVDVGTSSNIVVQYHPDTEAEHGVDLEVTSNDPDENPAITSLSGIGIPAEGDSDGDGIPDAWETLHFGGPTNAVADADNDGDGFDNFAEWTADTIPTNGESFFALSGLFETNSFAIRFDSSTNRFYSLQYMFSPDGTTWSNIPGQIREPGAGDNDSLVDTNDAPGRAYRIEVELP